MINVFYKHSNRIGHLTIALIFIGGLGLLLSYDGFILKSQAAGNCGSSFTADSCCGYGNDTSKTAELAENCCGTKDKVLSDSASCSSGCGSCTAGDCSCADSSGCCGTMTCPVGGTKSCYNEGGTQTCNCSNKCGSSTSGCDDNNPCTNG